MVQGFFLCYMHQLSHSCFICLYHFILRRFCDLLGCLYAPGGCGLIHPHKGHSRAGGGVRRRGLHGRGLCAHHMGGSAGGVHEGGAALQLLDHLLVFLAGWGGSTPCCRPLIAYQQRRAGLSTAARMRRSS